MMDNETAELIRKYLVYDETSPSGLRWAAPRKKVQVGNVAGFVMPNGYWRVGIGLKSLLTHRIIFWMHYGHLPEVVDHADGDPTNNRIDNLRAATKALNNRNQRKKACNTSGVKGVYFNKNRWVARLWYNGNRITVGRYKTLDEAERSLRLKRQELHKEFANHG